MKSSAKKYFVSIVGNIGVGKTTLASLLAEEFGWNVFYEKVIDNPYLPDYYKNMQRWSFHLQVYFFNHRFQEQREILNSADSCVQDRSIYEDPEIFAYVLHKEKKLSDRDYQTYLHLFKNMVPFLPEPDLFIYLKASTWTLLSRIRKRGREFEMGITGEFLHQLNLAYEKWMKKLVNESNVLLIDTDRFNINEEKDKLQDLFEQVKDKLNIV